MNDTITVTDAIMAINHMRDHIRGDLPEASQITVMVDADGVAKAEILVGGIPSEESQRQDRMRFRIENNMVEGLNRRRICPISIRWDFPNHNVFDR
jgi:hypothetical protein